MDNEKDNWINPDQLPKTKANILIDYDHEITEGYLDSDGEWYEYGGRKLDKRLILGWKDLTN